MALEGSEEQLHSDHLAAPPGAAPGSPPGLWIPQRGKRTCSTPNTGGFSPRGSLGSCFTGIWKEWNLGVLTTGGQIVTEKGGGAYSTFPALRSQRVESLLPAAPK